MFTIISYSLYLQSTIKMSNLLLNAWHLVKKTIHFKASDQNIWADYSLVLVVLNTLITQPYIDLTRSTLLMVNLSWTFAAPFLNGLVFWAKPRLFIYYFNLFISMFVIISICFFLIIFHLFTDVRDSSTSQHNWTTRT